LHISSRLSTYVCDFFFLIVIALTLRIPTSTFSLPLILLLLRCFFVCFIRFFEFLFVSHFTSVEPGYNDIGLCDISSIAPNISWQELTNLMNAFTVNLYENFTCRPVLCFQINSLLCPHAPRLTGRPFITSQIVFSLS